MSSTGQRATDLVSAGPGNDVVFGRGGDDVIVGGGGHQGLPRGRGRDELGGDAGDDRFYARDGMSDSLRGGPGRDRAWVDRRDDVAAVELVYRRVRKAR